MTVTVGIPTTAERPVLRDAVEAAIRSASLVSKDAEVLVVINGRADAPVLGQIRSPLLRVIDVPRRNAAAARNVVLDQARHATVLMVDDDVVVPDRWCAELASALSEEGCQVATAPVRVRVRGPLTAFINYQRSFDSQPPGPADPGSLVTANCGLRKDLLPPDIRFDESLTAGDDADLGYQLWQAGIRFRLLGGATPVTHDLPEDMAPNLRRSLRYGDCTATLTAKHGHMSELMPTLCFWYAAIVGPEHRSFRTFGEFASPCVRSAFRIYSFVFNSAYVVGCLSSLPASQGEPMIRLDGDRLLAACQLACDRAAEQASGLSPADWQDVPCDYSRLIDGTAAAEEPLTATASVIADLKAELRAHAPLTPAGSKVAAAATGGTGAAGATGSAGATDAARATGATDAARATGATGATGSAGATDAARATGATGSAGATARSARPREASRSLLPPAADRLRPALDELRRRPGPISEADIDQLAQASGISFRALGQLIERTFGAAAGGGATRAGARS